MGGAFLLAKATFEIHGRLEGEDGHAGGVAVASFGGVPVQILVLDVVFSLDSVITAVGMVDELAVMYAAVIIAMLVMLVSVGAISDFVTRHLTVKMLALSFLLLIGASLIAEGFDQHVPKGYVYGPIAFSIFVEFLNLRVKARTLALPLAVIVFLGAFVPLIGATLAGVLAALVAPVANGLVAALIVVIIVIAVNQLEGDLLQPIVMAQSLKLHPLVILVALTAGTVLGGITGAVLSVPTTAVAWAIVKVWTGPDETTIKPRSPLTRLGRKRLLRHPTGSWMRAR